MEEEYIVCSSQSERFGWFVPCLRTSYYFKRKRRIREVAVSPQAYYTHVRLRDVRGFVGSFIQHYRKRSIYLCQPTFAAIPSSLFWNRIMNFACRQLRFHPVKHSFLLTASEDGLMCYYDTAVPSEEDVS